MANTYGSIRGHLRLRLIRELAMGVATQAELATRFGVDQNTVRTFRERNEEDIQDVRKALMDEVVSETAGLWIADKSARVAEYQDDVERINELLESGLSEGLVPRFLNSKHAALKAVAEELAQLPTRTSAAQIDENVFHCTVVGVSTSDLGGLT